MYRWKTTDTKKRATGAERGIRNLFDDSSEWRSIRAVCHTHSHVGGNSTDFGSLTSRSLSSNDFGVASVIIVALWRYNHVISGWYTRAQKGGVVGQWILKTRLQRLGWHIKRVRKVHSCTDWSVALWSGVGGEILTAFAVRATGIVR
jgi:hypothetical protein